MASLGTRYAALLGCVLTLFVTFVACGSQLYKVSLEGDTEPPGGVANSNVDSAADPSSATYGLHASKGWDSLPIHFRVGYNMDGDQTKGLMRAMNIWETAVGKQLFVYEGMHDGVTGDSFDDLYSSLEDGINGHYLDGDWGKTGKPSVVLATTIWDNDPSDTNKITTADIRFNSNFYLIGDGLKLRASDQREVVDIQTLALHELGHLLGLAHMSQFVDSQSIMTPALYIGEGLTNRHLSRGDIERIHKIYGCQGSACDIDATLAKIDKLNQPIAPKPTVVEVAH